MSYHELGLFHVSEINEWCLMFPGENLRQGQVQSLENAALRNDLPMSRTMKEYPENEEKNLERKVR